MNHACWHTFRRPTAHREGTGPITSCPCSSSCSCATRLRVSPCTHLRAISVSLMCDAVRVRCVGEWGLTHARCSMRCMASAVLTVVRTRGTTVLTVIRNAKKYPDVTLAVCILSALLAECHTGPEGEALGCTWRRHSTDERSRLNLHKLKTNLKCYGI